MASPLQFAKKLLFAMSDETFLGSLDSVNFRTKHVEISHGYWLAIAKFVKNNFFLSDQPKYLSIVKSLFVERLTCVSATKIKKFFLGNIKRSFIDFKNLMYYIHHFLEKGNIARKDLDKLRQTRYFEYKARQHYLWYISTLQENQYQQQDVQPTDFDTIDQERLAVFPVAETEYRIVQYNNIQNQVAQPIEDIIVPYRENNDLFPTSNIVDQIIDQVNQREFERLTDNVNQAAPQVQQIFEQDLDEFDEDDLAELLEQEDTFRDIQEAQLQHFTPIQRIGPQGLPDQHSLSFPLVNNDHWRTSGQITRHSNGSVFFRHDFDDVTEYVGIMDYDDFVDRYGSEYTTD